nr:hypothetical protein [Kibdelosporangium sp. MJ126-NF4]CEL18192.1 hypothetical protein [Kibdelosporangium sp. MJ126-NF4]CTQ90578.1 hypothetical protein [Kibdelosporangium sp. MJ126-NF4]
MTTSAHDDTLLGIYLNDHMAGAVAGGDLARRVAGAERREIYGPALRRLAADIEDDRAELLAIMDALDIPVRRYKTWAAWAAARVGSLKPYGRLLSRSPLSRVVELEALSLGVKGKTAGWRTLRDRADHDTRLDAQRLDELIERARAQFDDLERLRALAAAEAFGGKAEPADGAAKDSGVSRDGVRVPDGHDEPT